MIKFINFFVVLIVFIASCTSAGPSTPTIPNNIPLTYSPTLVVNPLSKDGSLYSSSLIEISFLIPEGWYVEENESLIVITSDLSLQIEENLSFAEGDAIVWLRLISQENNLPFDGLSMIDMLIDLPPYLPPGKEPPHIITVNGKRLAFAGYGINKPIPYPSFTAMMSLEEKAVLGLVFTSIANERYIRGIFQNIITSIESNETR